MKDKQLIGIGMEISPQKMTRFSLSRLKLRDDQAGVALFMSLVMLLILTILGLSSVQTTSLQERMSRNARDTNLAFQSAESALRDGEDQPETFTTLTNFDDGVAGHFYEKDPGDGANWLDVTWSPTSDSCTGCIMGSTTIAGVATQPKYILEHVKTVISDAESLNIDNIGQDTGSGHTQVFRVTAYGVGGTNTAKVMLQVTYGKRF